MKFPWLRKQRNEELDAEIRSHLDEAVRDRIERGETPKQARANALREFGNVGLVKEVTRAMWGWATLERLGQDLRFGLRMLRKNPGFSLIAILTLAFGIGATTAIFGVVDAVLLKTLPVKEPEALVLFEWQAGLSFRHSGMGGYISVPEAPGTQASSVFRHEVFARMRQAQAAAPESPLSDCFAFAPLLGLNAVAGQQAEMINGQAVSGGYFTGLGVQPVLGRAITDEDDKPGAAPVVLLSHSYWQERFAADPAVIGQSLKLNQQSFTIIGVTPPGFVGALQVAFRPAVTVAIASESLLCKGCRLGSADRPGSWWLNLMGRLKPGATREQARVSLNNAFQAAALDVMPPPRKANEPTELDPKEYPRLLAESGSRGMLDERREYTPTISGLFIVVALVLLIACANLANFLLARGAARNAEFSVRLAVGAGRWRLMRQLLTESLLLASLGGALGVLFALWGNRALLALTDKDTGLAPGNVDLSVNWRVLLFTLAVSLLTGVLFGLVPAWRATKLDLTTALKQGRRVTGAVSRLSKGLIVAQVALSLLLLVGAGVFLRTLHNLQQVNLGFNQENLLVFRLQPFQSGYKDERLLQFYRQLFARLENLPGVRAASFGRVPLIADDRLPTDFLLPGETEVTAGGKHVTNRQVVHENYFATLEIPLLRGRGFTAQDDVRAPNVAIVSQAFAREFFPNEDVLGKRVTIIRGKREVEIIGVAADTKFTNQRQEFKPLLYTPWQQDAANMSFILRTAGEPLALANAVRQTVRELDSNMPVMDIGTQTARSEATLGQERLSARLLSFFGGLALLLAAIGLAGVLAYSVAQRTHEIGIRMALGAQTTNVLRLVIWQGMKLVLFGLAVGAAVGYALKRWLASQSPGRLTWQGRMAEQLYGVSPTDPLTLAVIATLLILVALLACWIPARRATKVDPMIALRHE
ncbi:MAG: ADOP family duplicated permease [Blastocatellia bacterium]